MIGWIFSLVSGTAAAGMAFIVVPAWGSWWIFLPWLGWWYVAVRHGTSVAQRIGGVAPMIILGIAATPSIPWAVISMTVAMIAAIELAERYLFPQRRRAAYGAAIVGSVVVWPWQSAWSAIVVVVSVSVVITHVLVRLKRWWWL